jgi:hypothetical protein
MSGAVQRFDVERRRLDAKAAQRSPAKVQAAHRGAHAGSRDSHRRERGLLLCNAVILAEEQRVQQ